MKELASISVVIICLGGIFAATADLRRKTRFVAGLMVFLYVLLYGFYAVSDYFTGAGINEAVIYHLTYGLSGAGFSEYRAVIGNALLLCLLGLCLWAAICISRLKVVSFSRLKCKSCFTLLLAAAALALNPTILDAYRMFGFGQAAAASDRLFAAYYVDEPVVATAAHRNFVFIYLESFEQNYLDDTLFPGLADGIKKLGSEGVSFSRIGQTVGSGWTIAGLVASQCGLPLFAGNAMSGMDSFLPGALCLGDVLDSAGYRLEYFGGADLSFAGKGNFFSSHRFSEVNGLFELLPKVKEPSYVSGWGLYDDVLFDLAFERFTQLSAAGESFGLFLLTLDTHHPDGLPSASCGDLRYGDGKNQMLNAVACSDRLTSRFVERIRNSPYGKDLVIFLVSDHLAMRNSASDRLDDQPRHNLFMVLDPTDKQLQTIDRTGTTLDIASTILPFIGLQGSIGLGRDLMTKSSLATQLPSLNEQLHDWQPAIRKLWDFPKLAGQLQVDRVSKQMRISQRSFAVPALIKVGKDLETEIIFGSEEPRRKKELLDQVRRFDPITPFIWIDECHLTSTVADRSYEGELCVALGRMSANPEKRLIHGQILPVTESFSMEADEIRRLLQ